MPHWKDDEFQQITCPWIDIFGFAGRQMEDLLDVAHFGFVHLDNFGNPDDLVVPPYMPRQTPVGFKVEYRSTVGNYPIGGHRPGPAWVRVALAPPHSLAVHGDADGAYPDEGRLSVSKAASPVSSKVTRLFAPIARSFDMHLPVQDVYDFNRRVFEEDKTMVEAQKPECLPLNRIMEAHIPRRP